MNFIRMEPCVCNAFKIENGNAQKFANTESKFELESGKCSGRQSVTFGLSNVVIGAGSKDL